MKQGIKSFRDSADKTLLLAVDFLSDSNIKISLFKLRQYGFYLQTLFGISFWIAVFRIWMGRFWFVNSSQDLLIIFFISIPIGLALRHTLTNYYAQHINHQKLSDRLVWTREVQIMVKSDRLEFEPHKNEDDNNLRVIGLANLWLGDTYRENLKDFDKIKHYINCSKPLSYDASRKILKNDRNPQVDSLLVFITENLELVPFIPIEFLKKHHRFSLEAQMGRFFNNLISAFPALVTFENYEVDKGVMMYQAVTDDHWRREPLSREMDLLVENHGNKIEYYCENLNSLKD